MLPNFMAEKLIINYEDYKLAVEKLALTFEKNHKPSVLVGIIVWYIIVYYILDIIERWL